MIGSLKLQLLFQKELPQNVLFAGIMAPLLEEEFWNVNEELENEIDQMVWMIEMERLLQLLLATWVLA